VGEPRLNDRLTERPVGKRIHGARGLNRRKEVKHLLFIDRSPVGGNVRVMGSK